MPEPIASRFGPPSGLRVKAEGRVAEVIRWLDRNEGAAGALSLESAIVHISSFELAYRLATDLAPHLADNQLKVISRALRNLAGPGFQISRVESFERAHFDAGWREYSRR